MEKVQTKLRYFRKYVIMLRGLSWYRYQVVLSIFQDAQ
jgi:hypothetical protein